MYETTSPVEPSGAESPQSCGDRYEILEKIDAGGMGTVYRGRHRLLNRPVAVKLCLPGVDEGRFRREAELLASLRSPHVVPVHDFDLLPDGRAMLVMEWVDGHDLRTPLARHPGGVPETDALRWMADVAEGLLAAERRRVVHRDLKPSNILLSRDTGRALVADFGLASSPEVDRLTVAGAMMGTPFYMSPEQAIDPAAVDVRADIYSFGATFYHLLTGRAPFDGPTPFAVLYKHKIEPLVRPAAVRSDLSPRLSDLLERYLAKDPRDRFQSFEELLSEVSGLAETLVPTAGGTVRSAWDYADDAALQPLLTAYQRVREEFLSHTATSPADFPIGPCSLTIRCGDIAVQATDAVVSSDDGRLTMGTETTGRGVAAALREAAGPELHRAALRFVPVQAGRAVVTPGFDLPARFVMHAVTIDTAGGGWKLPSRDIIAEIVENCFYHAETLNLRSIAFPLLGTGVGRFPRDVCIDTLFRVLSRKFLRGLTCVETATIVVR